MKFYINIFIIIILETKSKLFSSFLNHESNQKTLQFKSTDEEAIEINLFLKVSDKKDLMNNPSDFLSHTFFINPMMLYYFEKEKNSKKVSGSLSLNSLISQMDEPNTGKCCSNIGSIYSLESSKKIIENNSFGRDGREVQTFKKNFEFYCFFIDAKEEKWQLCSKEIQNLNAFRSKLLKAILENYFNSKNYTLTNSKTSILINFDNSDKCLVPYKSEWDYSNQNSWECYCNTGLFQSPYPLFQNPNMKISNGMLLLKYSASTNPVAFSTNGHEIEIYGNFGELIYQNPEKDAQIYISNKIAFKFPAEHKINNREYTLEIVIYHKNKDGLEEAALSVMVLEDTKGETDLNKFLEDIDSETWNFDESISILSKPNLKDLFSSNGNEVRRAFFSYMGSHTSPPCNENLQRFILAKPIKVPISQLEALKKKSVRGTNARIVKERERNNQNIMVYYNKGKKIFLKDKDTALEIAKQVKEKLNKNRQRLFPEKYIRVSSNISDFIVAPRNENDIITGEFNKTLFVNYLKENEIPEAVKFDLLKNEETK